MNSSEYDLFTNAEPLHNIVEVKSASFFRGDYLKGYQVFNASLLSHEGKLKCLVRNSSFAVGDLAKEWNYGHESYISKAEIIGSKMTKPTRIHFDAIRPRTINEYNGLEDPRYFLWRGREYALCVQPDKNIKASWVVLADLEKRTFIKLPDYLQRTWNKNWVPYVNDNEELYIISDMYPTIVYKFDDDEITLVHHTDAKPADFVIHGSSNIFNYKGIKTTLVHGRIHIPTSHPEKLFWYYWHAFMQWPEGGWDKVRIGRPFYFENKQIEFCTSVIEHEGNILITYSANDWGINILEINYDELEKLI